MPETQKPKNPWGRITWIGIALLSCIWWWVAAQGLLWRLVLTVALSLASFMVRCLMGFVFTSYGEETNTVGKVRDWLIGGLAGLTIAKAGAIKGLLVTFAALCPAPLQNLKEGLRAQPDWVKTVRDKWMQGKNLGCLLHDAEFRSLVGLPKEGDQGLPKPQRA